MDKNKKLFPQRLWDLVNSDKYSFLRWSDDGQRVYLNKAEFEEHYLKTPYNQFHTQKAISFVRQMNMYGFKKVDDFHYENDNFKKNCHHLIKNMVRRNSNRPIASTEGVQSLRANSNDIIQRGLVENNDNHQISNNDIQPSERVQAVHSVGPPNSSTANNLANSLNYNQLIDRTLYGHSDQSSLGNNEYQNNIQALFQRLAYINQINPSLLHGLNDASVVQQLISMLPRWADQEAEPTTSQQQQQQQQQQQGVNFASQVGPTSIARSSLASTLYQKLTLLSGEQQRQAIRPQHQQQQQQPDRMQQPSSFYGLHPLYLKQQVNTSDFGQQSGLGQNPQLEFTQLLNLISSTSVRDTSYNSRSSENDGGGTTTNHGGHTNERSHANPMIQSYGLVPGRHLLAFRSAYTGLDDGNRSRVFGSNEGRMSSMGSGLETIGSIPTSTYTEASTSSPCLNRQRDESNDSVINLVSKRYGNKSV
jgi:hypothetical protein